MVPSSRAACFSRRTCARCPFDNRLNLVLSILDTTGTTPYFVNRVEISHLTNMQFDHLAEMKTVDGQCDRQRE